MRDMTWRMGFTLTALLLLALVGPSASCGGTHQLVERLLARAPQAEVEHFLDAIARGDRQAALDLWWPQSAPDEALEARREATTATLLALGADLEYQILKVEWWRTCCEPGIIDDPGQAGAARFRVALRSGDTERVYLFDVLVPGGYWGDAAGNPVRTWVLADVYPEGAAPLVWTWR
jgi:hypothetical protein